MIAGGARRNFMIDGKLDSVTNYPFKEDILNFVRCGDGERLNNTVGFVVNNYPKHAVDSLMNVLDNHDTARLMTVLGDNGNVATRDGERRKQGRNGQACQARERAAIHAARRAVRLLRRRSRHGRL